MSHADAAPGPDEGRLAARLGGEIRGLFGRSLHIRTIDTGSCAVCESEIRLLLAPHYDLHRLGLFFTPAPRHARAQARRRRRSLPTWWRL
jgi:hypothetical protein